jgi:hypothetical protein
MPVPSAIATPAAHAAIVNLRMFPSLHREMPREQESGPNQAFPPF